MKKVELISVKDNKVYTTEFIFKTRGGTRSPILFLFKLGNHLITPFEFSKHWEYKNPGALFNLFFHVLYSDKIELLIPSQNPFLKMLPKDKQFGSFYHQPIILGNKNE